MKTTFSKEKHIPVICGPTGSGKTKLSLALAKELHAAIINADSMQIYRGLDIGTAKASQQERETFPHYLLDFMDPTENYNVSRYLDDAKVAIGQAEDAGFWPMIVGGTPQYVTAILEGIKFLPDSQDESVRNQLEDILAKEGIESLWQQLVALDPERAKQLHINDHKRIVRALEIALVSKTRQSAWDKEEVREKLDWKFQAYAIEWPRVLLYERINKRVDQMMEQGLLAEAEMVYRMRLPKESTSIQAIAYKEFFPYFENEMSLDEAIEVLKRNSRRYAKRQLTWYKKMPQIRWISYENIETSIPEILRDL